MAIVDESHVMAEIERIAIQELELKPPLRLAQPLVTALELDSLRLLTLIVGLENRFRITIHEDDAAAVVTAEDLARLVAQRASQERPC